MEHLVITTTATRELAMEKDTAFLKKKIHVILVDVVKRTRPFLGKWLRGHRGDAGNE